MLLYRLFYGYINRDWELIYIMVIEFFIIFFESGVRKFKRGEDLFFKMLGKVVLNFFLLGIK